MFASVTAPRVQSSPLSAKFAISQSSPPLHHWQTLLSAALHSKAQDSGTSFDISNQPRLFVPWPQEKYLNRNFGLTVAIAKAHLPNTSTDFKNTYLCGISQGPSKRQCDV